MTNVPIMEVWRIKLHARSAESFKKKPIVLEQSHYQQIFVSNHNHNNKNSGKTITINQLGEHEN